MAIKLISFSEHPEKQKPREKIESYGAESLNDSELLSVIFGTGYKNMNVGDLSKMLISEFGTRGLFQFTTLEEIQDNTGLPLVKSCTILAIGEYFRRINKRDNTKIKSSEQFYEYIKDDFKKRTTFEQLRIICLDSQRRVLYSGLVAQGESNVLSVTIASILYNPIRLNAKNFYLAHNHPHGIKEPSEDDVNFTVQIKEEACKFGLFFDDHIIIGEDGFYSFSLKGLL